MSCDAGPDSIGTLNGPLPTEDARSLAGVPDDFGRLWTPYRMIYICGEGKPAGASDVGCPFCTASGKDDQAGLTVYRGDSCFVPTDLFPYNSGHLFVCPYRHVSDYTELMDEKRAELGNLTATAICVTCGAASPAGFNLGVNQGEAAGAGITVHLHQHAVPRWLGDVNFLPIIAQTKTVPKLLEDIRARLTAAWPKEDQYSETVDVPS